MNTLAIIRQMQHTLTALDKCLTKAEEYATARPFDVNNLIGARLAPDMLPFAFQIQATCDAAKFAAAYASGQKAPSHPDTEKTFAELHQRIATVQAYLTGFSDADFAGASDRKAAPSWARGAWLPVEEYLMQVSVPNFYFHATTAYDLLRHSGVPVGKNDFLGAVAFRT